MRRNCFFGPLPISDWPTADRAAWIRAGIGDPLCEGGAGPAAHWRDATKEIIQIGYGVWLAWLRARGGLDEHEAPGDRARRQVVREFLEDMRFSGLSEITCSTRLVGLGTALRVIAPDASSSFIVRAGGRLISRARRGRTLTRPGQSIEELLALGQQLANDAIPTGDAWTVERALDYRDGLLFSLLVHRPVRVGNLASIQIGAHLVSTRTGYRLNFRADEMKAHRDYSCLIPESLVPALDRYLDEVRPILAGQGVSTSALWLSIHGRPLAVGGVTAIVGRRTTQAFGIRLGPHLVRHIVATAIAERLPHQAEQLITTILGHLDVAMSERHYNHALGARAAPMLREAMDRRLSRTSR